MSILSSFRAFWQRYGGLGCSFVAVGYLYGCCDHGEVNGLHQSLRISGRVVTNEPEGRLVVLGVDGLPPDLLIEAIEAGLVPSFEALYREGAFGSVDVLPAGLPPLSPRIWTSYSTGQLPEVHGIHRFVRRNNDGGETLYNSTNRAVPAIWNIATALGRSVGVVNWWASSPAESVRGFLISDLFNDVAMARLANHLGAVLERNEERVIYPLSLIRDLRAVSPIDRRIGLSARKAEDVDGNVIEMALVALQKHPVQILLVYTRAFDELAHVAWGTHEPLRGEVVRTDLILEYLRRYDWLLGRFLTKLGPNDHLMILSDHGFERSEDPTKLGGTHESPRTARALLVLKGPRIRRNVRLAPIDVLDVLPTMLELAGLPTAKDMPGRVAREAFRIGHGDFLPRVDSYELIRTQPAKDDESIGDDAMKERLRALGYLDDAGAGK